MTNFLEGNMYNTVRKSADTQGATVRSIEVRFYKLVQAWTYLHVTNTSFTKIIHSGLR